MTQRIFDVENEKDMADLWSILPDDCLKLQQGAYDSLLAINWHDKTEITRPIQEATEQDIGKLCRFWNDEESYIGILVNITNMGCTTYYEMDANAYEDLCFLHCHRLTKQEIEELC